MSTELADTNLCTSCQNACRNGNFIPMPKKWIGQYYNACTDPCDMLQGPCACGAWHHLEEWIIKRKKLVQGKGWVSPEG